MDDKRKAFSLLAGEYLARGDATGWFEALYAKAAGDASVIPWADLTPNEHLIDWLARGKLGDSRGRAMVIGCGLGDDAERLAWLGLDTWAFDISPTSIRWAKQRFPDSPVHYEVADLLALPAKWNHAFDFVLEVYTLQVLPPELSIRAMRAMADLVAPGGRLLVICRGRGEDDPRTTGLHWPPSMADLREFEGAGLETVEAEDFLDRESPPVRRFRVEYRRP